ncbi:MAG: hypothetical protein WDN48_12285 [Pseudolabrys sp.]
MRKVSSASVAMILAIALYFTLFWGFDALRVLTSPTYGLEDVWRSQYVFGIGALFGFGPMALMKLAAFFGTLKLAAAVICAIHIVDRFRGLAGSGANSEILEGGLILVVLITIASAGPALWSHNTDLVRDSAIQLAFAALATALCMVERSYARSAENDEAAVDETAVPQNATWFTPWR